MSPNGRFLAFASDETGQLEVHVAAFANGAIVGQSLPVSGGLGGDKPKWSHDSRRLFYRRVQRDRIMSVTIELAPVLTASAPVVAFDLEALRFDDSAWSILPDNRLVGVQRGRGEDDPTSIQLILNWLETVRGRLPLAKRD